jgi:alkanesulfonate monooxygenase SsuD/methylene tetrahydromethanopterin reductase-like flavin-dependent oxidoreductase (luciferase family)
VAAIGAQGDSLMFMAYTMCEKIAEARAVVSDYRAGRKAGKVAVGFHTHVGASDAEARSTAKDAFDRYCSTRVKARKRGYDEAVNDGVVLFGSPDTVAQQIIGLRAMGVDEVLTLQNFGALPAAAVQASMTRLMNEVMPKVRQEEAA